MAAKANFEKIIWLFVILMNFLAVITVFEYGSFIVPMVWANTWIVIAFKVESVLKAYVSINATRKKNK